MTGAGDIAIGQEEVTLVESIMEISVITPHAVRLRVRDADGRLMVDIATTPLRALRIAGLFKLAAERADPSLIDKVVDLEFRR